MLTNIFINNKNDFPLIPPIFLGYFNSLVLKLIILHTFILITEKTLA